MKKIMQSFVAVAALSVASLNVSAAPAPLGAGTCPGTGATSVKTKALAAPYVSLHGVLTSAVISNLNTIMGALNAGNYDTTFKPAAEALLAAVDATTVTPNDGRVVITLPDGTVAYDSGKLNNTWTDFQGKLINENHNSRVAILASQEYQCGLGVETRLSSSTGAIEDYVARRLGNATSAATYVQSYLNNNGTVRVSIKH